MLKSSPNSKSPAMGPNPIIRRWLSKPKGSHFGEGAPPILEPILVVGLGCSHGHMSRAWSLASAKSDVCRKRIAQDTKNGWPGKCHGLLEARGSCGTLCGFCFLQGANSFFYVGLKGEPKGKNRFCRLVYKQTKREKPIVGAPLFLET